MMIAKIRDKPNEDKETTKLPNEPKNGLKNIQVKKENNGKKSSNNPMLFIFFLIYAFNVLKRSTETMALCL